jgi:F-type H+-transporting ATPase subunit b
MGFSVTTFLFEIANFLVLVWLLQRLLYRPIKRSIEERRKAAEARSAALSAKEAELSRRQTEVDHGAAALDALRERIVAEAMEQGEQERARLLEQARQDVAAELSRVHRLLETERDAAQAWVRDVAVDRGTELAGRILVELAPEAADRAFFERLLKALTEVRSGDLEELGDEIEATFARVPPDTDVAELRSVVERRLGKAPRLQLREDPALEAGCVVRMGYRVFDASLAGRLELLRAEAKKLLGARAESD